MASGRPFVLLGSPVEHSISPAMQSAAFHALSLHATYIALPCNSDDVPHLLGVFARAGGGGNVTIPHKPIAARTVNAASPLVTLTGACNTFWGTNGQISGDNTDVAGILAALDRLEAPGTRWLILGTGGAARAAGAAAAARGVAVAVRSRSADRQNSYEAWATEQQIALCLPEQCEVAINATPLGLRPHDPLPLDPASTPGLVAALDLVYAKEMTAWVRAMRERGVRAADGREVLVAQGAAALEQWFPDEQAPRELMRAVVNANLR
jgi:shikimate dehydrogenase